MTRGDKKDDSMRSKKRETLNTTCNSYIFGESKIDYNLVDHYAEILENIQSQKGAKIFFTPPAVAGHNCYNKAEIDDVFSSIKRIFFNHNINVIGDPYESLYEEHHMLDTYYHIDSIAAKDRTQKLIHNLRLSGMNRQEKSNSSNVGDYFDESILQYGLRDLGSHLSKLKSGHFSIESGDFYNYFYPIPSQWLIDDDQKLRPLGNNFSILSSINETCNFKFNFIDKNSSEFSSLTTRRSLYSRNGTTNIKNNSLENLEQITLSTSDSTNFAYSSGKMNNSVPSPYLESVDISCSAPR
jgi:hypothetical protein